MQIPAPPVLYLPIVHTAADALDDPAEQKYPGLHVPLQFILLTPTVAPNRPAGQSAHTVPPPKPN